MGVEIGRPASHPPGQRGDRSPCPARVSGHVPGCVFQTGQPFVHAEAENVAVHRGEHVHEDVRSDAESQCVFGAARRGQRPHGRDGIWVCGAVVIRCDFGRPRQKWPGGQEVRAIQHFLFGRGAVVREIASDLREVKGERGF